MCKRDFFQSRLIPSIIFTIYAKAPDSVWDDRDVSKEILGKAGRQLSPRNVREQGVTHNGTWGELSIARYLS